MRSTYRYALIGIAAAALLTAGCSSGCSGGSSGGTSWSAQTSAAAGGGMSALVTAAKQEGTLNVIALPADWANYGNIIKDFTAKYGIKVNSANPNGSSQDEVDAVKQENGTSAAPDVLDVGNGGRARQHQPVRPLRGQHLVEHPRRAEGGRPASGSRTTAATCPSATTRPSSRRSPR